MISNTILLYSYIEPQMGAGTQPDFKSKLDVSIWFLPLEIGEPRRWKERMKESMGVEHTGRTSPSKSAKQGLHGLKDLKAHRLHGSAPGPLLWLSACVAVSLCVCQLEGFVGLRTVEVDSL